MTKVDYNPVNARHEWSFFSVCPFHSLAMYMTGKEKKASIMYSQQKKLKKFSVPDTLCNTKGALTRLPSMAHMNISATIATPRKDHINPTK